MNGNVVIKVITGDTGLCLCINHLRLLPVCNTLAENTLAEKYLSSESGAPAKRGHLPICMNPPAQCGTPLSSFRPPTPCFDVPLFPLVFQLLSDF